MTKGRVRLVQTNECEPRYSRAYPSRLLTFALAADAFDVYLLGLAEISAKSALRHRPPLSPNLKQWTLNMVAVGRPMALLRHTHENDQLMVAQISAFNTLIQLLHANLMPLIIGIVDMMMIEYSVV